MSELEFNSWVTLSNKGFSVGFKFDPKDTLSINGGWYWEWENAPIYDDYESGGSIWVVPCKDDEDYDWEVVYFDGDYNLPKMLREFMNSLRIKTDW